MPAAEPSPDLFIDHSLTEDLVDLGEIRINFATLGSPEQPALLLLPGQTESWWGYEAAMPLLAERFQVYAVDLRGQGRSTRTPGRYTLDNMGNDLVRFIDLVIARPTLVSGNSSGGLLAAWLAAYAKPTQITGVVCEDPPFFASELQPACGQGLRQSIGPIFAVFHKWLGEQWSIGDWPGLQAAMPRELAPHVLRALVRMGIAGPPPAGGGEPPQNLKEYDPGWAGSFWSGAATAGCDHAEMLASVLAPVLITHHYRELDPATGSLMGAVADQQVAYARALITAAGQPCEVIDLPEMVHSMHRHDPARFADIITTWASSTIGAR